MRGSCFLALATALPPRTRIAEQRRSMMAVASLAGRSLSVKCPTQSDTLALGAALATVAKAGDVVLLRGDYGAGKTCLARGFLRAWFDDPDELVTSPSYLIDNVYPDDEGRARPVRRVGNDKCLGHFFCSSPLHGFSPLRPAPPWRLCPVAPWP